MSLNDALATIQADADRAATSITILTRELEEADSLIGSYEGFLAALHGTTDVPAHIKTLAAAQIHKGHDRQNTVLARIQRLETENKQLRLGLDILRGSLDSTQWPEHPKFLRSDIIHLLRTGCWVRA